MSRSLIVMQARVERGETKRKAEAQAAAMRQHAQAGVSTMLSSYSSPAARAAFIQVLLGINVGQAAVLCGELPTACRLSAMSRRLVPDLPKGDAQAAAKRLFIEREEAA